MAQRWMGFWMVAKAITFREGRRDRTAKNELRGFGRCSYDVGVFSFSNGACKARKSREGSLIHWRRMCK